MNFWTDWSDIFFWKLVFMFCIKVTDVNFCPEVMTFLLKTLGLFYIHTHLNLTPQNDGHMDVTDLFACGNSGCLKTKSHQFDNLKWWPYDRKWWPVYRKWCHLQRKISYFPFSVSEVTHNLYLAKYYYLTDFSYVCMFVIVFLVNDRLLKKCFTDWHCICTVAR